MFKKLISGTDYECVNIIVEWKALKLSMKSIGFERACWKMRKISSVWCLKRSGVFGQVFKKFSSSLPAKMLA